MTRVISSVSKIKERESPRSGAVSTPAASSRSSVSMNSAPRGTASVSLPSGRARSPLTAIGHHRPPSRDASTPPPSGLRGRAPDRGRAGRGQVDAEGGEEAVVAAAAAEHMAERRVVDLEDRPVVIAEVAQQAEVDLDPLGDPARLPTPRRSPPGGRWARSTAAPPIERASFSTSLPPRSCERAMQVAVLLVADAVELGELNLEADQVVGGARRPRIASRASPSTPNSLSSWR